MQQQDFDRLLRGVSGQSEPSQAASRLQSALQSEQGRRLTEQLTRQHGSALEQVTQQMQAGDMAQAQRSIEALLQTPEGARLAAQVSAMLRR